MRIVVLGDVVVDHHVYEGERSNPAATQSRGVRVVRELGGAAALAKLIDKVCDLTRERVKAERAAASEAFEKAIQAYEAGDKKKSKPERAKIPHDPLEDAEVRFGLSLPELDTKPCGHHGLAIFKPYPKASDDPKTNVWRASTLLGYGHDDSDSDSSQSEALQGVCDQYVQKPCDIEHADVLVLDDAAFMFRKSEACWMLHLAEKARWIILKISTPVCSGALWSKLQKFRDKLIVVASVTELRPERAGISEGLSWERTVSDLAVALADDPTLRRLMGCRHVITSFSADGGLWIDNSRSTENLAPMARLVFDAGSIEGQWAEQTQGAVFGFLSCMVAAITKEVASAATKDSMAVDYDVAASEMSSVPTFDLARAIASGLTAMRDLRTYGHGIVSSAAPQGYPVQRLAKSLIEPPVRFSRCLVPWQSLANETLPPMSWSIAVQSQIVEGSGDLVPMPMIGLAQQVVIRGRRVLQHLPNATFGALFTIDRQEIETLRTLRRLMKQYKHAGGSDKPLSLGVFGPPGAGKSFGVKQIAHELFGKRAWLEFNLSQFAPTDLIGALHQVRDRVLEVGIPVVFWDEFDSRNYEWLQYLLAPMQDGRFQEGQLSHPIGSCIFIFAGATSFTFQQFGPPPGDEHAEREFKLKKGPDFASRLDGYYNVLGPNPLRDVTPTQGHKDACAPIRRSLLIRNFLCGNSPDQLKIDPGLLRTLLELPTYTNGARSLQKLAQSLKPKKPSGPVRRSDICSPSQLAMFVSFENGESSEETSTSGNLTENTYRQFTEYCRKPEQVFDSKKIESLAAAIHTDYLEFMEQHKYDIKPQFNKPYIDLRPEDQAPNLAAARRIPVILAIAGLELKPATECSTLAADYDLQISEHIKLHLEIMAESEHDLWCEERYDAGWTYCEKRDDDRMLHNLLVPYQELDDQQQDKDRDAVRNYSRRAASIEHRIVFIGTET